MIRKLDLQAAFQHRPHQLGARWPPGGQRPRATESYPRLALKIGNYGRLAAATGNATPVLFWFPTTARETSARRALAAAVAGLDQPDTVPVATTATPPCSPSEARNTP